MVPGLGPLGVAVFNELDKNPKNDGLQVSPALAAIERLAGTVGSIRKALTNETPGSSQRNKNLKALSDSLTALNVLTGLPTAPIGRFARFALEESEK